MADIRIRDYESSDAEDLNRIAISAFAEFRDHDDDWPAMRAGLSPGATGEIVNTDLQDKPAGAVR